jgi:hypothetical protein
MKRSSLVDVFFIAALLIGATALLGFVRGMPGRCATPSPSSVEALFAPCLAADRQALDGGDLARLDLPALPPTAPTALAAGRPRHGLDVETTGSIAPAKR